MNNALAAVLSDMTGKKSVERFWLKDYENSAGGVVCEVIKLPKRRYSFGFEPCALITLQHPTSLASKGHILAEAFDLTPVEVEIALALGDGRSRDEIAETRRISAQTVSAHLKSIYRKCASVREAETVALVNRLLR